MMCAELASTEIENASQRHTVTQHAAVNFWITHMHRYCSVGAFAELYQRRPVTAH
jgi:hypothetical protein